MTKHDRPGQLGSFLALRETMEHLLTGYQQELEHHEHSRRQLDDLVAEATSADNLVTVGVDGTGTLASLELGWETFGRYTPAQLAATVLETARQASAEVREQAGKLAAIPMNRSLPTDVVTGSNPIAVPTEIRSSAR